MKRKIILASSSPRRRELLTECGVSFEIVSPDCDETVLPNETPEGMVKRLALLKADTIAAKNPDELVIGADTTVFWGTEILGKPLDKSDACKTLGKIQGQRHSVWGGIAVVCKAAAMSRVVAHETIVQMAKMSADSIAAYVATSDPLDKAGSYGIQGIGSQYIEWIHGSYTNVVGLNVSALMQILRELGCLE